MKKFAQILPGQSTIHGVFEYEEAPNFHPDAGTFIDVTDLQPVPFGGWTYDDGVFSAPAGQQEPTYLYAHVELSGGDGLDPAGIEVNSEAGLAVTITIRASENPLSPVIDAFSGKWRVHLRSSDGRIYDIVGLNFINGAVSAVYPVARAAKRGPAVCQMLESDLTPVIVGGVEYRFRLVGDTTFKVYEDA
ncbi:MAG: hypothetical protein WA151_13980 [Desulfatirhabdiaceae bacterium]